MSNVVLEASGLTRAFGGVKAVDNVDLRISQGELHAIIGPNGAGKTTFLSLLSGELAADRGRVLLLGQDVSAMPFHKRARLGMARTFQVTSVFEDLCVQDNIMLAAQSANGHAYRFWQAAGDDKALTESAMHGLELVGLASRASTPAAILSHGERRALEIAMALACRPKLLLLDEPMAGIGTREAGDVVERLRRLKASVPIVLIEHDMNAVFSLADRITVLAQGRVVASDVPSAITANAAVQAVYLGTEDSSLDHAGAFGVAA